MGALLPWGNGFLRFTSGVTPADLLAAGMAVEPFRSTYLRIKCTIYTSIELNGVFTLSETENDFCSETNEMAKSSQSHWVLLAISSVSLQKSFSVSLSVNTP